MAVRREHNRNVSVVTTSLIGLFDLDFVALHPADSRRVLTHTACGLLVTTLTARLLLV
jgi:hypothetical protein